jgi:hypothetical protein
MSGHSSSPAVPVELLEQSAAENLLQYARAYAVVAPARRADWLAFGGVAGYTGVESPLTTVKGAGPELTDAMLDEVEAFFAARDVSRVAIEAAPWLTLDSIARLETRGYIPAGGEDVMIREVPSSAVVAPDLVVEPVPPAEWPELMRRAFELPDDVTWRELCGAAARLDGAVLLGVRDDTGAWMACAQSVRAGDAHILGCDGTLPHARGRGAQLALIAARLKQMPPGALVGAEVEPGGGSQRNYFRAGFRLAYHRTHYWRTLVPDR